MFTVIESVDHWLEANCHIPAVTEATQEVSIPVNAGLGTSSPAVFTPSIAMPVGSDWPTPCPHPLTAEPNPQVTGSPRAATVMGVAPPTVVEETGRPLDQTLEELDPEREATIQAFWALLAELGYEPL